MRNVLKPARLKSGILCIIYHSPAEIKYFNHFLRRMIFGAILFPYFFTQRRFALLFIIFSAFSFVCKSQGNENYESRLIRKSDSLHLLLQQFETQKLSYGNKVPEKFDTIKANLFHSLFNLYYLNDSEKAKEYAEKALKVSTQAGFKKGEANAYNGLGIVNDLQANYSEALMYYNKALLLYDQTNDKLGQFGVLNNMGIIFSRTGNFSEAMNSHLKGLEIAEELGDDYAMLTAYISIGIINKKNKDYDKALINFFRSLELSEKINDKYGQLAGYINVGQTYLAKLALEDALNYFDKGLKIALELQNKYAEGDLYNDLGTVYFEKADYNESLKYFMKAVSVREALDDKIGLAKTYVNIGEAFLKKGDKKNAVLEINKGLNLAKEIGGMEIVKDAYGSLSRAYSSSGNYELAYNYEVLFKEANDSLFNIEKMRNISEAQLLYGFNKVRDSIAADQAVKNAIATEADSYQRRIRNYIYIGLGIIIIFLVILIFQRNKIATIKNQQALELERSRISKDLHDDLGTGISGILMLTDQLTATAGKDLISSNINKIHNSSRLMMDQMKVIVWALNTKNDTFENLLMYLESYLSEYKETVPYTVSVDIPETIPDKIMKGASRRHIILVVKETMNNIYKYAKATQVTVTVKYSNGVASIIISDNGIGFDVTQTSRFGNGLLNIQNRMTEMKGTCHLESVVGKGTTSTVIFPVV